MAIRRRILGGRMAAVLIGVLVLTFLLFAATVSVAVAVWTPGGIEVCGTGLTGNAQNARIIPDGSGGSIIAWQDTRNGKYDLFAQKVDQNGAFLWALNGVDVRGPGMSVGTSWHSLVSDGAGGTIIAWFDQRDGVPNVFAQRLNASGEPQWALNGIEVQAPLTGYGAQCPAIAPDGSGGAIITWYEYDTSTATRYAIFAQRIDSSGQRLWTADGFEIRGLSAGGQVRDPRIIPDGAGGAIIAWQDYRPGLSDIYAQRVDESGTVLWAANGVEICGTGIDVECWAPELATDGSGGAIITWWERYPEGYEVFAQRVEADGQCLWAANGVNVRGASYPLGAAYPVIAADGSGGAVITWSDGRNDVNQIGRLDIYVQKLDSAGSPEWTPGGIALTSIGTSTNSYPKITSDNGGGAVITWLEGSAARHVIRTQKVSPSGMPKWADGGDIVRGTDIPGNAFDPVIASDAHNGAIVAWRDDRSGKSDIYAQRVVDPAPAVTSIMPATATNMWAVDAGISGSDFSTGATVRLVRGSTVIEATNVVVASPTSIRCNLNISGQPLGKYDVIVRNPDGQEGKLAAGLAVTDICGQGAAASISVFAASMGLLSAAGIGLRRRRRKRGRK